MTVQTTLEQWLDSDDGPSVRTDRLGNAIDREICEASTCTHCGAPSPRYIALRCVGRYVALAECKTCHHVEEF